MQWTAILSLWKMLQIIITCCYLYFVLPSDSKKVVRITETAGKHGDIHLSFLYQNKQIRLHLEEDNKLSKIPLLVGENQNIFAFDSILENETYYADTTQGAYFMVKNTTDGGNHEFHGVFQTKRDLNVVQPYLPDITPGGASERTLYVIQIDSMKPSDFDEDFQDEDIQNDWVYNLNSLQRKQLSYVVELLVVVDHSIYKRWYQRSVGENKKERRENALKQLQYYFLHVVRGINMRYQSIKEDDYDISIRGAGIYVALTKHDSPWTKENIYTTDNSGSNWINASESLSDLDTWLNDNSYRLPVYDQATAFTRHQLAGAVNDDGSRKRLSGLANIKGVCTYWKGSICRDAGLYAAIQTAAHELGHSLGAPHDGDGNACKGENQYIMAGTPEFLSTENYLHPFTFSTCSITSMRAFLFALTFHGTNCLLDNSIRSTSERHAEHHDEDDDKLPGQLFSLDEQCKHMYDSHSYFCSSLSQYYSLCRRMFCYNAQLDRCYTTSEQRAALGTPCGQDKWCIHGDCVSTDVKPKPIDSCVRGNGDVYYSDATCQDMVTRMPYHCYNAPYKYDCCRQCIKIADDSKPGCEYGDRELFCASISGSSCYDEQAEKQCCKTCPKYKIGLSDCAYGDRASWCETISPRECYANEKTCCKTCREVLKYNANYECRYGDQYKWCSTISIKQCYDVGKGCCQTCKENELGLEGCNYGDRIAGCSPEDCLYGTEKRVKIECCLTCSKYKKQEVESITDDELFSDVTMTTASPVTFKYIDKSTFAVTKSTTTLPKIWTTATTRSTTTEVPTTTTATITTTTTTTETTPTKATTRRRSGTCIDDASWCRTMPTRDCYVSSDTCCQTCDRANVGPTGCEYGDRVGWCRTHVTKAVTCKDPIILYECCNTCNRFPK